MTIMGLRIARPRLLLLCLLLLACAAAATTVLAGGDDDVVFTPVATGKPPVPLSEGERQTALRLIAGAIADRGVDTDFDLEVQSVYEESGTRLLQTNVTFKQPVSASGPWLTRTCSGTRLSESAMQVNGFTRLSVAVDLRASSVVQIVPDSDDPATQAALNSARDVVFNVLDPKTRERLLTRRIANPNNDNTDPATVCPPGTYGR